MAMDGNSLGKAAGFLLGSDLAYNMGSFSLSSPQTAERRVKDTEGTPETETEAMKWVWISTAKVLGYNGFASLLGRTWWPFIGGLVFLVDLHASYGYAIRSGKKSCTPAGRLVEQALGVQLGEHLDEGREDSPPSRTGYRQWRPGRSWPG
jgi:hypothetical protein